MTPFDTRRGRVWAVLIGLMGGMIIGMPFRPGLHLGWHCHHRCDAHWREAMGSGCPWLARHRDPAFVREGASRDDAIVVTPPGSDGHSGYVVIPPSPKVREIHVAPGVGVRLQLAPARPTGEPVDPFYNVHRDPFIHPAHR